MKVLMIVKKMKMINKGKKNFKKINNYFIILKF